MNRGGRTKKPPTSIPQQRVKLFDKVVNILHKEHTLPDIIDRNYVRLVWRRTNKDKVKTLETVGVNTDKLVQEVLYYYNNQLEPRCGKQLKKISDDKLQQASVHLSSIDTLTVMNIGNLITSLTKRLDYLENKINSIENNYSNNSAAQNILNIVNNLTPEELESINIL